MVECARLEIVNTGNCIKGSNPFVSARLFALYFYKISLNFTFCVLALESKGFHVDKIRIVGGIPLYGTVNISGAKNAVLPLMCASLLTDKSVVLTNVPLLSDVTYMNSILGGLGTEVFDGSDIINGNVCKRYTYKTTDILSTTVPYDLVRKMRASYYVLGPLLARKGEAKFSLPGGCTIGVRPIDIHLSALEQMGANIKIQNGYIIGKAQKGLKGANLNFPSPSVGATCNVMMAATLAKGKTVINNAAREPEISDLAKMLNSMGAKISGAGTSVVKIDGVNDLGGTIHNVISDRIEAGSYAIAAAVTNGRLELINAEYDTLVKPIDILRKCGVSVEIANNSLIVDATNQEITAHNIITAGYPGFPTDLQAQFMAMLTLANGVSEITETIFENRFMHVPELIRMGAKISVKDKNSVIVNGVKNLSGASVMASDLRASFALVLAGLAADGETEINRVYHLDRGYETVEKKLQQIGANIQRIKEK